MDFLCLDEMRCEQGLSFEVPDQSDKGSRIDHIGRSTKPLFVALTRCMVVMASHCLVHPYFGICHGCRLRHGQVDCRARNSRDRHLRKA